MTTLSAVVATDGWDVRHIMSCPAMIVTLTIIYLSHACMHNDNPVGKTRHDAVIMHALRIAGGVWDLEATSGMG